MQPQGESPPHPVGGERQRLAPVSVEEILETDVVTAQRDTPIPTIAAEMAEKDIGSVVVVDDDSPVGIVTDRSIALSLETNRDYSELTAEDLMSGELVTGSTDMSVFDALRQLDQATIRRLPIVDEADELEGIVTLDDILVFLGNELQVAASIIESQSPRL